ncbi:MAG TPA: LuxR C-terminal-related transcriptional regulator [Dehalococcoidales bacterium]|nr:LuxR C-terminal-related transcriptional regulator [Dehalococcoidales bacterium]
MINWLINNFSLVVLPILLFLFVVIFGLLTRHIIHRVLLHHWEDIETPRNQAIVRAFWLHYFYWFLLLGAFTGNEISKLTSATKTLINHGLGSLFVISLAWLISDLFGKLINLYLGHLKKRIRYASWLINISKIVIGIIAILTILEIWGLPTEPVLVIVLALFIVVGLALKEPINKLINWIEITNSDYIKVGDTIKLGSGEIGLVTHISWTNTIIKTTEGNSVIIPHKQLTETTLTNYGAVIEKVLPDSGIQPGLITVNPKRMIETLSSRELEILRMVGKGATNIEIAHALFISEHTVKSHVRSILNKLNIRNRQQAAVYAERAGLVEHAGEITNDPPINSPT